MGMRVSAPGPKLRASGIAPATVATEVIKIGRSRTGQASKESRNHIQGPRRAAGS